jgi:hypothetical protein
MNDLVPPGISPVEARFCFDAYPEISGEVKSHPRDNDVFGVGGIYGEIRLAGKEIGLRNVLVCRLRKAAKANAE